MKIPTFVFLSSLFFSAVAQQAEPTNAEEAAAAEAKAETEIEARYSEWFSSLNPAQKKWERTLQAELGDFYLPIHKKQKANGQSNAWDFVEDDPSLPRVLLIGDSVSRAYTQTVRKDLMGKANVHRAPANCGPTRRGLEKLDVWLGDGNWEIVHFNFGIHDRNLPVEQYAGQLEQLVIRLKETGADLVWASTTPIPDSPEKKYAASSIVERNAVAAKIMKKHGVETNDLYSAIEPRLEELQNPDDVHFNSAGNEFLGHRVADFLESRL